MKKLLYFIFFLSLSNNIFAQFLISNRKFLNISNENTIAKVIIIDNENNKNEFIIEENWIYGWSEDIIGDFKFIFIKTENNIEGIFIIHNEYERKNIPYDILTKEEYERKMIAEYEENLKIFSYEITINFINNKFEIEYDISKFTILCFLNYENDYLIYKNKYFNEFNFIE